MSVLLGLGDTVQATVLDGSLLAALGLAVLAGLVSFASPCVLPLVPGYLGYLGGMAGAGRVGPADPARPADDGAPANGTTPPEPTTSRQWRTLAGVALFVAGFTAVFVAFGVLAGSFGGVIAQWSDVITRVLGVVVVAMGLVFVGWIPLASGT